VALQKAEPLLVKRLGQLQDRLQAGDEAAWTEFLEVVKVLSALLPNLRPEAGGPMLTTAEMASRLGVAAKTLLRHKRNGRIQPAVEQGGGKGKGGKLLRWSGQERLQ
jgi:hypothetical protein